MNDSTDTSASDGPIWVVGVDGSEDSIRALKWAAGLAPTRASTLRIVRSWSYAALGGLELAVPVVVEDMQPETAYELLDEFTAEMASRGVGVESRVEYGAPATVLLDACEDADLLIVGARGQGGFARLLLGSTSHQCATHARVPVVVVPKDAPIDAIVSEVVVGMDASTGAKAALEWALEFAPPEVPIRVIGAWHASSWLSADKWAWDIEAERANEEFNVAIDEVEKKVGRAIGTERSFGTGQPASMLLEVAPSTGLLVVGERGRRGVKAAILGSVATEVLHRASCPVAVIPVVD